MTTERPKPLPKLRDQVRRFLFTPPSPIGALISTAGFIVNVIGVLTAVEVAVLGASIAALGAAIQVSTDAR